MRRLMWKRCRFSFQKPFRLATRTIESYDAVEVRIGQGDHYGRGESPGLHYLGDTLDRVEAAIDSVRSSIEAGAGRTDLLDLLPPGGARNALDCALWDLECRLAKASIWSLTGLEPVPLTTAYSLSIAPDVEAMAQAARKARDYPLLKVKIDTDAPLERLAAIRDARADARLIVDANQSLNLQDLPELARQLAALGVELLEQPLPRGGDGGLERGDYALPLCADESCQSGAELDQAADRYDMINIKLDKVGGLTAAFDLLADARARGLGIMVGNMFGTSLAMAPAFVLAQRADYVDLDGPLYLARDRAGGLRYQGPSVNWSDGESVWGADSAV